MNDNLKLHVEALENLIEERKDAADALKDRFALLKAEGFDVKVTKAILARRALERQAVEEFDQMVITYEEALA